MSWVMDYRRRPSVHFDELLYQSPQLNLGQLATISLKKTKSMPKWGKQSLSESRDSISLINLVTYIESILSPEIVTVRGV